MVLAVVASFLRYFIIKLGSHYLNSQEPDQEAFCHRRHAATHKARFHQLHHCPLLLHSRRLRHRGLDDAVLVFGKDLGETVGRFYPAGGIVAKMGRIDARMEELSMSFAQSLEIRDFKTGGHSRDVLQLGSIIAEGLDMPLDHKLKDSLLLHDIGKIGIPDRILLKESPLDDEEWRIMKNHPEIGYNLLKNFDSYKEVSRIILAHQEHYNGTGYPKGLKGNNIPLIARIIGVADAYHAMTNDRPYRKALSTKTAIAELLKYNGKQFDPQIVEGFINGLIKHELITGMELAAAKALLLA